MPVSADDFLRSAAALYDQGSTEIDWRNTVSRAFYGSLHKALNFANDRSLPDPSAHLKIGSHERVIKQLTSASGLTTGKQLAYILEDMKRRRVIADYRLVDNLPEQEASLQLKTAQRFEQALANTP